MAAKSTSPPMQRPGVRLAQSQASASAQATSTVSAIHQPAVSRQRLQEEEEHVHRQNVAASNANNNRLMQSMSGRSSAQVVETSTTAAAAASASHIRTNIASSSSLRRPSREAVSSAPSTSEKLMGVVAPSPSGSLGALQVDDVPMSLSSRNRQVDPDTATRHQYGHLPQGAATMLSKFVPFTRDSYETLKNRVTERKHQDEERKRRRELEEAHIVDGNLIVMDDDYEEEITHDPKLISGKSLPNAVAHNFPKSLLGVAVEDVDPLNRQYNETFLVISRRFNKSGYIYRFSAKPSLYLFWPWNPIRRLAVYAYTHPIFDIIVMFTILANSLSMAMNVSESIPEYTFLAIFTLEGITKAIAKGLIIDEHTYLRDGWNWLDFIVLVSAYATIIAQSLTNGTTVNIQALRTFRVFRVLKTIAIIPGLKTIIEALIRALKMLGDVLIMTLFFFTIFALFGVQLFQGTLQTKCVLDADSVGVNISNSSTYADPYTGVSVPSWRDWVANSSNWFVQDNGFEYAVCGNMSGAQQCPDNYTCILVNGSPNPNNDFTKFDNFYSSFMVAVQLFNTDYWDVLYRDVLAANGPAAFLFFVVAIVFLNYYLANLVQAVVALSYQVDEDDDDVDETERQAAVVKEPKRRFVFDPYKLRLVRRGPGPITRSLLSVRTITEKRLSHAHPLVNGHVNYDGDNGVETQKPTPPTNSPVLSGKPVAVVKPQLSLSIADNDPHLEPQIADFDHGQRLRVVSRPPSAVSSHKLPEFGFWDRNHPCCIDCCAHKPFFGWLKMQHHLYVFVTDPFFELFITLTIVINTISMAAHYYNIPDNVDDALDHVNDVCTYVFILEAILKLTAMSKEYFVNRWNWLDFIVVIGSIVDTVVGYVSTSSSGFSTSIIRLLRLLRILKLAQSWKTMRTLLEIILGTIGAIGNLMLVLLIVIFIFAVIGMQLFGGTYTDDIFLANPTFTPFPGFTGIPEWNWDDFFHSFMMVFRILCRETYQPMWDCISANNPAICIPFYIATLIVGSYVVLNLFLAVLLNAFNSDELKKKTRDAEDDRLKARFKATKHFFRRMLAKCVEKLCPWCKRKTSSVAPAPDGSGIEGELDRESVVMDDPHSNSEAPESHQERAVDRESEVMRRVRLDAPVDEHLHAAPSEPRRTSAATSTARSTADSEKMRDCCWPFFDRRLPKLMAPFQPEACFGSLLLRARTACFRFCVNKIFEYTILGFIFISSISLCLQDANLEDGSTQDVVLNYVDYVCLGVFTIELLLKMFAVGIRRYFTSFWTLLDFFIVVTGFIDVGLSITSSGVNLSSLRALRTLRALRPLRAISRWQGMKIVVNALISSIPGIVNVLLVVLIIWLIFAIMGVQFFSGKFWMCVDVATGNRIQRALAPNRDACLNNTNWAWTTYFINFDNVAYAYLALFQMGSFEGWTTIFQLSVDAPSDIGDQPAPELNVNYYVYYLIFLVFCSFFLLNLFVGVIIDDFNALKKKYEGGTAMLLFMTDTQKRYYATIKQLGSRKPRKAVVKPHNPFSLLMFNIASSQRFEYAIAVIICANVIVMATEHFDQAPIYSVVQDLLNIAFTTIFSMEALLKIAGFRQYYFFNGWNIFDFIVVIVSILSIGLNDILVEQHVSPSLLRLLRVLRIGRIVRIFRASKGVRKLLLSFIMSLPALFNIACLLFLIIFIYAIIGMNLFGHVGHYSGNLDDIVNFHTFPNALLTLFRLTTISGWDNVHQGLSFTDDPASGCNPNADLLDLNYAKSNPCCNRTFWKRPNGDLVPETGSGGWGNCGNFSLATIYLVSYLLLSFFIIVNMFAAVILDNYQQATNQEDTGVTDDDIEAFYRIWEQYDPLATQFIKYPDLPNFVAALEPPLGLPRPNDHALTLLDIPIMKDKNGDEVVHCLDVLMGVVRKALGFMEETDEFVQVKLNLEKVFNTSFPNRVQVQRVTSTKQRKKEDVAARVLQRNWRKHLATRDMHRQHAARVKRKKNRSRMAAGSSSGGTITARSGQSAVDALKLF